MQDIELLAEWVEEVAHDIRREIEDLPIEALTWQSGPQANSIGVTVWHVSRWLDLIAVRALQNHPAKEEQWHTKGWAAKTGYNPQGIGENGFGAVSGYTWEEVEAIPNLSAAELLTYLDQVTGALRTHLQTMSSETLHQPALGFAGSRTAYDWIKPILKGCLKHLGEIQALKAMQTRATADS